MPRAALPCAACAAALLGVWFWRRRRQSATTKRASCRALRDTVALRALFKSKMGFDIGGTLAKLVFAGEVGKDPLEGIERKASTVHRNLEFVVDGHIVIRFLVIPTHRLEEAARSIRARLALPESDASARARRVVAAGGGAHRFRAMMREVLHVDLLPFKELEAVVRGLEFLAAHGPARAELYTIAADGAEADQPWPAPRYPLLLVNMGSGVSILKVAAPGDFARVGGTACGGATFLGLGRALTGESDFGALMKLAMRGDEQRVDKSVGDIYGDDGCADLGMSAAITAANFGRLASLPPGQRPRPEDLVRAVLKMVVQASVVVVKAFAEGQRERSVATDAPTPRARHDRASASDGEDLLQRVFFVGGFVGAEENTLARQMIASSMAAVGGRALFCRRAEFLGALGSLADCVRRHETSEV